MKMLRPGNLFTLTSRFVHEDYSYDTQDDVDHYSYYTGINLERSLTL